MKKYFIFVAFLMFLNSKDAYSQLEVVWQKTIPGGNANFSPDGKWIYFSENKKIRKYDVMSGELISTFDTTGSFQFNVIYNLKISKSGNYMVSEDGVGPARIWDVKNEKFLMFAKFGRIGNTIDISPNDEFILVANNDTREITKFDFKNNKVISTTKIDYGVYPLKISNDGRFFVVGTKVMTNTNEYYERLYLWDALEMKEIGILQDFVYSGSGNYTEIKFSKDDKYLSLVFDYKDGYIYDLNLRNNILKQEINKDILSIDVLPNSLNYLITYKDPTKGIYTLDYFDFNKKISSTPNGSVLISSLHNSEIYVLSHSYFNTSLYKQVQTSVTNLENINQIDCSYINNKFVIQNSIPFANNLNLTITDLQGKQKYSNNIECINMSKIEIPIMLPNGFYFSKIISNEKEYLNKFEVVR